VTNRSLACVIAVGGFAQHFALLCSRLRSSVVRYDEECCWMWGWETEGKGKGYVGRVL
jgi:hypothetical protein